MLTLGGLTFAAPWMLAALALLPIMWWLLRLTPPAPRRVLFPPLRLLLGLLPKEETPHRTPWWLILLRLVIAGLVIAALAQPLLRASETLPGDGPIVILLDNGWSAAPHWDRRTEALDDLLDQAARTDRSVLLVPSADLDVPGTAAPEILPAAEARRIAAGLAPRPWPADPAAALAAIESAMLPMPTSATWLADGLAIDDQAAQQALATWLQGNGDLRFYAETAGQRAHLVLSPRHDTSGLVLRVARADAGAVETVALRALDADGGFVARQEVTFAVDKTIAEAAFDIPGELRNRIASIVLENEEGAGAVYLLDESWRQRPVGLVAGGQEGTSDTLLGDLYYVQRALESSAELREGMIEDLLMREMAVLILADVGTLGPSQSEQLAQWIERGGVLVRFAGPRLAQQQEDDLLPVRIRAGDRMLGGAMSWAQPASIAPFPQESPFAGLVVPPDVRVARQILAEPDLDLGGKIWARLADGTPLVTGERRGEGWTVLVHTTANADWSNLALSGLFVQMLERLVALSQGVATGSAAEALPPLLTLDGFGRLGTPPAQAGALAPDPTANRPGPTSPPGYYGYEAARRGFSLADGIGLPAPFAAPTGIAALPYAATAELALLPWLLAAALLLLAIDGAIGLALRGLLMPTRRAATAPIAALAFLLAFAAPAIAQETAAPASGMSDEAIIEAIGVTRLAFIVTGDDEVDATTMAGLQGLTLILHQRTAAELGTPVAIHPDRDELAFYPILYWPVTQGQPPLNETGRNRINEFMRNGGMLVFDLRDPGVTGLGASALQTMTAGLDIPPLTPLPAEHVLARTFYLLREFPGRWTGGTVWVERAEGRVNDGVASVVVGSNDWAAAWAIDELGRPMFPVVPGGDRQREFAFRFGVNLAMYALTGNYKSDQVHIPSILERLGQ
ncbi:MAG: DUF4159 domain-containing protein [Dongiaceae bacterium]